MKKFICGLLISLTTIANAGAYISNKDFIRWDEQKINSSFIIMYIMAVNDVYDGTVSCAPDTATGQDLYDTVFAFIKLSAIDDSAVASRTVIKALKRAFPCPNK